MLSVFHGADLHLDSPFSGLSRSQAALRRGLQRQLPMAMVEQANRRNCQLLLLAGDVFDGSRVCPETVEALKQAFSAFRGRVFVAPGNHDPYGDTSPWAQEIWPGNVHIFKGPAEAVTLPELGCRVWGGGFTSSQCYEALPQVQPQGLVEIGLFHGDPETNGPYRSLSEQQIKDSGLHYLALGHIHKTAMPRRTGKTWYGWPGAAMGRGFDETGIKGAFHVMLDEETCRTEFVPLPGPRYEIIHLPAGVPPETVIPSDSKNVICRLILTGTADGSTLPDLSGLFHTLEVVDQTLPEEDVWQAAGEQTLRGLALARLKQAFDEAASETQRQTARLAARYVVAALDGRDAP